jgi:lipid-binding SYLF domain-containing protein
LLLLSRVDALVAGNAIDRFDVPRVQHIAPPRPAPKAVLLTSRPTFAHPSTTHDDEARPTMTRALALTLAFLAFTIGGPRAHADEKTDKRLEQSQRVFESFSNLSEQAIPSWLLERAYGVVVIPKLIKGAFFAGGRGGRGVMAVRQPDGSWSNPVFVTLGGANIGFQWGVQSTEVVFVLVSRQSVEGLADGKVTLGADASVAAGPVGRSAAAATDATFKAQVLAYARNEGIFAGVALDGSVISVDDDSNATAYGVSGILASQILEGRAGSPSPAARAFTDSLSKATGPATAAAARPATTPASPPATPTEAEPAATDAAETYPMEDPEPGSPPPE